MTENNTKHILHALEFDGEGGARIIPDDEWGNSLKSRKTVWIHLDTSADATPDWLLNHVEFPDEHILEALMAEETRPRLVSYDSGVMLILRGVNLNENADPDDMVSIRLWIYENNIVSVRRRRVKAVTDIRDLLDKGRGPKNEGEFITLLVTRLFERMEPALQALDDRLDMLEEHIMESPDNAYRQGITEIRKQAIQFKRYIAPQRDVISSLRNSELPWLGDSHRRKLLESLDRVIRYIETLDAIRERGQIVKDELANALSDRMNKNLYMLSVVAAIFLPLGFLTGLLGINVGGIPGSDLPTAFMIFCAMLTLVVIGQYAIFKYLKWF